MPLGTSGFLFMQISSYAAFLRRIRNIAIVAHTTEAPARINGVVFFASAFALIEVSVMAVGLQGPETVQPNKTVIYGGPPGMESSDGAAPLSK